MSPEADPPIVSPIQLAYNWAIATCEAPNVGYSQAYRNQQTVDGITYYDCSSFIWYALKAGGYPVVEQYGSWPFTTYTMGRALESLGFTHYDSSLVPWLPGDIVVFKGVASQGTGQSTVTTQAPVPTQTCIARRKGLSRRGQLGSGSRYG